MAYYYAVLHKEPGTAYGLSFPDLPGLVTGGATADEALRNARSALAAHIAFLHSEKQRIPPARAAEALLNDPDVLEDLEGGTLLPVELKPLEGRAKRVSITLDEYLLVEIDEAAEKRRTTRSAFLAEGARQLLTEGG